MVKLEKQECEQIFSSLNIAIGCMDKVASAFYGEELTALALLLGLKKNQVLDTLSHARYILQVAMEKQLSDSEYDDIIEQEAEIWTPHHSCSKEELLSMAKER